MDYWDLFKLLIAVVGLVLSPLLVLNYFRKPVLRVSVEVARAELRSGPRLYYQINLTLRALYGPIALQRAKLSHASVPNTRLHINYALGEVLSRDLLGLPSEEFHAVTEHHLGDKPSRLPPSLRLPGLSLAKGESARLTLAGFIPFIASSRQLDQIPVEGWDLEFQSSAGTEHVAVFTPQPRTFERSRER